MTLKSRIAVIGAGAAGLASIRELRRDGHEVVGFERTDRVGGHWNIDYDALHLITPKSVSMFRDYPQPAGYPDYASRKQVVAYLHKFAEDERLVEHIRFGIEVLEVVPPDGAGLQGWDLHLDDGTSEHFDAVVVANGHLHHPFVPELPGDFAGKILHSVDYHDVSDIDGSRVLVIGAGNSGCDLAVDAAQARFDVSISVRHGFLFMPKSLWGMPRLELPISRLPFPLYAWTLRALIRVSVGHPEQYGLPKPATRDFTKQRAIVNDLLPYWIKHGRVTVRPDVQSVSGNTVTYMDGTTSDVDTILLATGFRFNAPFLSRELIPREGDMPRRWGSGLLPADVANLYIVGLIAPMGAQWPIYDMQAQQVAQMLRIQRRLDTPLVDVLRRSDDGFGGLELQRPAFMRMYAKTKQTLDSLQAKGNAELAAQFPSTHGSTTPSQTRRRTAV